MKLQYQSACTLVEQRPVDLGVWPQTSRSFRSPNFTRSLTSSSWSSTLVSTVWNSLRRCEPVSLSDPSLAGLTPRNQPPTRGGSLSDRDRAFGTSWYWVQVGTTCLGYEVVFYTSESWYEFVMGTTCLLLFRSW